MVPSITITDEHHTGIVVRALVDHARHLINEASDPEQQIVTRRKLVGTARIALDLAHELMTRVPNMPVEYPDDFDAEFLVWLKNMR